MKKFLMLLLLFLSCSAPAVVEKRIDTPANRKILQTVQDAYNSVRSLKANFAQFNSQMTEDLQTGVLYLKRPGRMRLAYEKGSPLEFVATNGYFIYHDKDLKEVNYFELSQTPVHFILKDKISFTDPDFLVTDVQTVLDEYFVSVVKKDAPDLGTLTLIIDKNSLQLKQWDVLDMQGIKSTVSLFNIQQNFSIDNSIFLFNNPYKKGE